MIKVDINIQDQITGQVNQIKRDLAQVPQEALNEFRALTPIKSGNARRSTYLQGDTIRANYPYAQRLDEGYSKQAPRGMTEPFTRWLERRIKQIMER